MNPIDALEEAIRQAEIVHKRDNDPTSKFWGFRQYARAAADALTTDDVVANAVRALHADGWVDIDLPSIARTVLRSVKGG